MTRAHYTYVRDHDPGIGRYFQSDPMGLKGGISHTGFCKWKSKYGGASVAEGTKARRACG